MCSREGDVGGSIAAASAKSSPTPQNGCTPRIKQEEMKKTGNLLLNDRPFANELVYPDFRLLLKVIVYL
jgi:hypothetical protein